LKKQAEKGGIQFIKHDIPSLNLLKKEGIPARVSFVFGLPGEDAETMQENLEGILDLVGTYPNICDVELNPVEILPGTKLFDRLLATEKGKLFANQHPPYDTIDLSIAYHEQFCKISRDEVLSWIKSTYDGVRKVRRDIRVNTKGITEVERLLLEA